MVAHVHARAFHRFFLQESGQYNYKLNIFFSYGNEKRAAQVGFETMTYCLQGRQSMPDSETTQLAGSNQGNTRQRQSVYPNLKLKLSMKGAVHFIIDIIDTQILL